MRSKSARPVGTQVSWNQVTAFRLRRHHLSERARASALPSVVSDIGGAQAQVPLAAQMSLWARTRDLRREDVETALWKDRTLVTAWCMRRTLHLLPSEHLAVFVRGSARRAEKEIRWVLKKGVSERTLNALLDAVFLALDRPVSRTEMAEQVSRTLHLPLTWKRGGGWGSHRKIPCVRVGNLTCPAYYLLHLAGARGVLCSGPNRGNEATFVRADAWLRGWKDLAPEEAEDALLRSYLHAFGPATVADFFAWTRMRLSDAKEIWARQEESMVPVDVEGRPGWALPRDLPDLVDAEIDPPVVRLLPYFDSYLLGHLEREHLVRAADHRHVYREQGWVAPVVLVNGKVEGVWSHVQEAKRLHLRVEPLGSLSSAVRSALREEGHDLGRFLGHDTVKIDVE